jgi:hypothetical protein
MKSGEMSRDSNGVPKADAPRLSFDLATQADDCQLRQLLRNIRMEGIISVSFRREPNYFAAHDCEGEFVQVIVARDRPSSQIVGMGSRSLRELYVDGAAQTIGYLSGLRIHPAHRGGTMLARGYRFLRKLDEDQRAAYYLTTIATENRPALEALVGGRGGLPYYERIGQYVTWIVPRKVKWEPPSRQPTARQHQIRPINQGDVPELLRFIHQCAGSRQFIPRYQESDFCFPARKFPGMSSKDLWGLWVDGALVGTLGIWDQRGIKQVVVERYGWWLQWLRPLYNCWAKVVGRPSFPQPGECLPLVATALPLATPDGVALFGKLIDEVANHLPDHAEAMMIGMSENDPLTDTLRRRAIQNYKTEIYVVAWDELKLRSRSWHETIPYLELGTL